MTVTGHTDNLYDAAMEAADSIRDDVIADLEQIRSAYEYRQASPEKTAHWEKVRLGFERARAAHASLLELGRKLRALPVGSATLSADECALFAYVRDPEAGEFPALNLKAKT